jgi:predicted AlkP superfamily pyrophosphatase or phosphodiesterase
MRPAAILGLALLSSCGLCEPEAPVPPTEHVVLVSIDGLRPEFYQGAFEAPALRRMAGEGVRARAVESVFPSSTYPAHATMVTGVRPWKHGIHANTLWGENGGRREWHWWAEHIKARTLWDAAREKGRTVAIVQWPSTVGAPADWRVAEVWDPDGKETLKRLQAAATPGLVGELVLTLGVPPSRETVDKSAIDAYVARAAGHVFRKHRPNLMLVHLLQVDEAQHATGRTSEAVRRAVRLQDENIARLRKAVEEAGVADRTLFIVTGDHGFRDVDTPVNPNAFLAEAGFVEMDGDKVKSWRALAHAQGGSAAIYVKDPLDVPAVARVLSARARRDGRLLYTVLDRARLDGLGYNPDAALALEAADGVMLMPGSSGMKGVHGHLPTRPELATGFLAVGPGVRRGSVIDRMRLLDIAPTVAAVLGLDLPEVEGRPLRALAR